MIKMLLFAIAVSLTSHLGRSTPIISQLPMPPVTWYTYLIQHPLPRIKPISAIRTMLESEPHLSPVVVNKVIKTLHCALQYQLLDKPILTVIDYSLPSNQKRLWVFNLAQNKLLYHTYVSHGLMTGTKASHFFSNRYNSKASSIGIYKTAQSYYGREGISLRLKGLDVGFNDNAENRAIVMHGGWYMEEPFIQKYGRAGRSWGCPALPKNLSREIIETIRENTLFVMYYPNEAWFNHSKFLNCSTASSQKDDVPLPPPSSTDLNEPTADFVYADLNHNHQHDEYEPVIAISAGDYESLFQRGPPLSHMLRRRMDGLEYIALSLGELQTLATNPSYQNHQWYSMIQLIIPKLVMHHGYYETEMHRLDLGPLREVKADNVNYLFNFSTKTVLVSPSHQFVRWLGL